MSEQLTIDWKSVKQKAGPYTPEAFQFVRDGLSHTVRVSRGADDAESRHVSGQELCFGLKDYAIKRYGMLARTVLERWGIRRTDDFGRIVFAMVDLGLMRKTEEDSERDFSDVYSFDEAFDGVESV
ncbi:MAG: Minf_1886 family protein [Planctomycetota bacterium]